MNRLEKEISLSAEGPPKEMEGGGFRRTYCFAPGFIGFSGHFPGYPILPAFVQVLTVLSMAREIKGATVSLLSLERAKFQAEIYPGRDIEVEYREGLHKGRPSIDATLSMEGLPAARLLLTFREG